MKGNTGLETRGNRPVIPEELKSRSRCNGHPISMSAKSVAGAFAPCEKAVKTFQKSNVLREGVLQIRFTLKCVSQNKTGFSVIHFTGTVILLCSRLTLGRRRISELTHANVS
jgi:hypothetical protein